MKKYIKIICGFVIFIIMGGFPFILVLNQQYGNIITYYGSFAGCITTLIGVYITMKSNQEQTRYNLKLQYYPALSVSQSLGKEKSEFLSKEMNYKIKNKAFKDDYCYDCPLIKIENCGRGEIIKCTIKCEQVDVIQLSKNIKLKKDEIKPYIMLENEDRYIPVGNHITIMSGLHDIVDENGYYVFKITLSILVRGVYSDKDYKYSLSYCIEYNKENNIGSYKIWGMELRMLSEI